MTAQVLVMCTQCGRPQKAAPTCVACGAALPESPARNAARSGRDQLLDAYAPYLEGDLGGGKKVLLSEKRLEWTGGEGVVVELSALSRVELRQRPVYEALLFCALSAALAPLVGFYPRLALGILFVLGLCACFLQRRYALVLIRKDGTAAECFWGMGRPRSAHGQRVRSIFATLGSELRERRVEVAG